MEIISNNPDVDIFVEPVFPWIIFKGLQTYWNIVFEAFISGARNIQVLAFIDGRPKETWYAYPGGA